MQKEYYDSVESLQRRELLRTDEKIWIEVLYWSGNGPTKDIINAFRANDTCKAFMGMIRPDSFKPLDSGPANSTQVRNHKKVDSIFNPTINDICIAFVIPWLIKTTG